MAAPFDSESFTASTAALILSARNSYLDLLDEIERVLADGGDDEEFYALVRQIGASTGLVFITQTRVAERTVGEPIEMAYAALGKARPLADSFILLGAATTRSDLENLLYLNRAELEEIFDASFSEWLERHGRDRLDAAKASAARLRS